mmetsp:Transcript_31440/g.54524  ORF Transcript_31440/g.54524 Transcript_31440/m.54524 type:complete len:183 (+) Transcript_31440:258-806(+)
MLEEMFSRTNFMSFSVASKAEDGELVGYCMAYAHSTEPKAPVYNHPDSEDLWQSKLNKLEDIIQASYPFDMCEPDQAGRLHPNSVDVRSVLELFLVGVNDKFAGRNIAYDLMLLSTALGYLRGLTVAVATCTNPRSSHFYKIGGHTFKPLLYREYEIDGEKPFADAEEDGIRFVCSQYRLMN